VRGVVQALRCCAVLVPADALLGFLVLQKVLVVGKFSLLKRLQGALFPPLVLRTQREQNAAFIRPKSLEKHDT